MQMLALKTLKTPKKFHHSEIWKASQALCHDKGFSMTLSLTSFPCEKASSSALTTTTNRNHAESSISTFDLESDFDEEIVSGSA